ncbi:unnamed protein product [Effrenium voratum]|uniref:Uncharacterized protein n=1 Tax=Effrenium voratum TaxID=2562239 RepID=A0AA36N716_9DINO|nr:unnamed protein product [Effrenium voratum]
MTIQCGGNGAMQGKGLLPTLRRRCVSDTVSEHGREAPSRARHLTEPVSDVLADEAEKNFKKSCTAPVGDFTSSNEPLGLRQTSSQSVSGGSSRSQFRAAGLRVMFGNYWSSSTRGNEEAPLSQAEPPTQGEVSLKPPNRATHVAAEIAFDGGTSPYCVISHSAPPKDVFEQVIGPVWYLRTPNLVLSIMGGAGNMNLAPDKFDIDGFSKGLVEAATRTCAWVITGGTASGVMDIVGKAMQRHDKQRQVPCIGISPFGALTSKWREILCSPYEHHSKTKVDAAAAAKAEKGLAALQDNHSHFIVCDNGEVGNATFSSEITFRTLFEDYVAKGSTNAMAVPRVMILVNGGKMSLDALVKAIKTGCPLVVCQGTGRIADVICSILDVIHTRPAYDASGQGQDEEFTQLLKSAVEEFMGNETMSQEDIDNTHAIVHSGKVEIYSINDRLEDVILAAVLGGGRPVTSPQSKSTKSVGVWQQLALAVQWGCTDYYDGLGRRLIQERGHAEAIRLIFQELVAFGAQDNVRSEGEKRRFRRRAAKTPISIVRNVRENAGPLVAWLLQHYLKQMDQFEVSEKTLGDMGKVHWKNPKETWRSLEGLLLFSIEQEAPSSVLEIIWSYMEDPVHAALAAASACRDTAEREHGYASYQDGLAKKELDDAADRFERLAVLVVEDLAQSGKGVEYLFQESLRWQVGKTCFKLAHELGCKMFVSATFYRLAVDLYWTTPVPFHVHSKSKRQLDAKDISWWDLLKLPWTGEVGGFSLWEFLSIPSIQAWTHGAFRSLFVGLYSYAVFYQLLTFGGITFVEVLLFVWGLGLGLVEVKQLRTQSENSFWARFQAYIHDFWNFLDCLHITVLLTALSIGVVLADKNEEVSEFEHTLEITHAMNLLPCWIRVLQVLQLSEYFGTLLITIFGMAKDAVRFFILVVIFCFGFSCAITPILFSSGVERDEQGLIWVFWTIVGNLDDKALTKLSTLTGPTRLVAVVLLYTLALVCNVLLVNLLIAVMNSTYEKNQAVSQTQWAFYRVEAVLEFDHESILPPPLNLLEPWLRSVNTSSEDDAAAGHDHDISVTRRDLKDAQTRAFRAITFEEDTGESAMLRAELAELRLKNLELAQRNKDLEAMAANCLMDQFAKTAQLCIPETPHLTPGSPKLGLSRRPGRLASMTTPLLPPAGASGLAGLGLSPTADRSFTAM